MKTTTMHYISYYLLGFLLLAITACKETESTVSITGTVTDLAGSPLDRVTITNSTRSTTITNASGEYNIIAEKDGTLNFEADGYVAQTVEVDGQSNIDIALEEDPWVASFTANNNRVINPQFPSNSLIPSVSLSAPAATDPWFSTAPYAGAVATAFGNPWYADWSFFSRIVAGNTTSAPLNSAGKPILVVNDAWMQAQGTTINWSADTVYVLDSLVFVGSGQTLNYCRRNRDTRQSGNRRRRFWFSHH